jgi:hypothetical protein
LRSGERLSVWTNRYEIAWLSKNNGHPSRAGPMVYMRFYRIGRVNSTTILGHAGFPP